MKRALLLGLLLTLLLPLQSVSALPFDSSDPTEFQFNRSVAVKHAIAALEDFIVLSMPQMSLDQFDLSSPSVAGVITKSCEGKNQNLVLVGFPGKKPADLAYVHLIANKDGLITEIRAMGFTVQTWNELVRRARSPRLLCE